MSGNQYLIRVSLNVFIQIFLKNIGSFLQKHEQISMQGPFSYNKTWRFMCFKFQTLNNLCRNILQQETTGFDSSTKLLEWRIAASIKTFSTINVMHILKNAEINQMKEVLRLSFHIIIIIIIIHSFI